MTRDGVGSLTKKESIPGLRNVSMKRGIETIKDVQIVDSFCTGTE